jgi:hypothetical protein
MTRKVHQNWILIGILIGLILSLCFIAGCASMESSSTDHHNSVPQVNCTQVKYNGVTHQVCCELDHCVFTN